MLSGPPLVGRRRDTRPAGLSPAPLRRIIMDFTATRQTSVGLLVTLATGLGSWAWFMPPISKVARITL